MFNKINSAAQNGTGEAPPAPKAAGKGTIEKIYQKKTQLEHILLRPDTYIGSVERTTETMWIFDKAKECMVQKELSYVPGKKEHVFEDFIIKTKRTESIYSQFLYFIHTSIE